MKGTARSSPSLESSGRPDATGSLDPESERWLEELRSEGNVREAAVARLRELLLRAARFEVSRRRKTLPHLRGDEFEDIAQQSANDAVLAVLRKLDDFRGHSRFTTWAYKFALLEAAVNLRRRAWQGREVPVEAEAWSRLERTDDSPARDLERAELFSAIREVVETALTRRQREVLVAVALNEVPIDVLAEREGTTRGALYKVLHDARRKLRAELARKGMAPDDAYGVEGR